MFSFPTSQLYIDGQLTNAQDGRTYTNITPWTGEAIGEAADASLADLDRAIAAARRASDATNWSSDHQARLDMLEKFKNAIAARRDEIGRMAKAEAGCTEAQLFSVQCDMPIATMDYVLAFARAYAWEDARGSAEMFGAVSDLHVWHEAVGVVGCITPWNVPLSVNLAKIFPALCAGCTVILKPAPDTPYTGAVLGQAAADAGLPAGVFNVMTSGDKATIGEALVHDPRVDMISFTGSTSVGKRIMAAAAGNVKRVFLELGGKSANIILDDASFAQNVASSVMVLFHAGQGCAALTRLLVPKSRYAEAINILTPIFQNFPYGDSASYEQIMGPIVSEVQLNRILDYFKIARSQGARIAVGGRRASTPGSGFWIEPTLIVNVTNDMRIAREEIFGPALVLIGYEDEEDAIRIANDSDYGLAGGICGVDVGKATAMARRIRTGSVGINGGNYFNARMPFGGRKQSGIGRENGKEGFEEYLQTKSIAYGRPPAAG